MNPYPENPQDKHTARGVLTDTCTQTDSGEQRTSPLRLLLHACCGPCSLEPVRLLTEQGWQPEIFYANSNIHPREEYDQRLDTLLAWSREEELAVHEGSYQPELWDASAGFVWEHGPQDDQARAQRCRACYRLRFEESAAFAKTHAFTHLGTTLSVSPYQYTEIIEEELTRAARKYGLEPLFEDYRPYYEAATLRSRSLGMYRQNYCGCRISDDEAKQEREERRAQRQKNREAEKAARAEKLALQAQQEERKRREKAAYAEKQRRKREILKELRAQSKASNNTE